MTDAIDELFGELDAYYPGSRRKRRESSRPKAVVDVDMDDSWEKRSFTKRIHGQEMPMYTIGALAQALNKSEKSVRLWTTKGYIPSAPYRMPSVTGVDGVTRAGRRLYTKEMVEAAIDSFARRGLLDAPRVEWSRHSDLGLEIKQVWDEIQQQVATLATDN